MEITIIEDNKNIKKALVKEFPNYRISVRNGSGTAYGWKEINIETNQKEERDRFGLIDNSKLDKVRQKANKIIYSVGRKIYHYSSDDGYNTERSKVFLQVCGHN